MKFRKQKICGLGALLLLIGTISNADAAYVAFQFTYAIDFASSRSVNLLGLEVGGVAVASARIDGAEISSTGLSTVTITPTSDSNFFFHLGNTTLTESDDVFGGPEIDFANGAPIGLFFDAYFDIPVDGSSESFILEAGNLFGAGEIFELLTDDGGLEASGRLQSSISTVPLPGALLLLVSAFAWMGVSSRLARNPHRTT